MHRRRLQLRALAVCLWSIFFASCAKVGVPPGGPEDKSGPAVARHYPEADATNVPRDLTATIEFSEPVNRASVETALFFAPEPGNRMRYRWHGKRLDLQYLDPLVENRTYVISIGSSAKDQRGNPIGYSYTIAFSTGNQIDRGRLAGMIADEPSPQSISIWCYQLYSDSIPDPAMQPADYRLQAGRDGKFQFAYLALGRYRVFAVHDRNFDGIWQPITERIGIAPWDVTVTDTVDSWIAFKLSNQDTSALAIKSVREIDQGRFELKLNRPVDEMLAPQFVGMGGDTIESVAIPDTADLSIWQVFPTRLLDVADWFVLLRDSGSAGWSLMIDTISVRAKADTSRPRRRAIAPDSRTPARFLQPLTMEFDEPVQLGDSLFVEMFATSADSDTVYFKQSYLAVSDSSWRRVFQPIPEFHFGPSYRIQLNGSRIMDVAGNAYADSTIESYATFLPADSLGGLSFKITGGSPPWLVRVLRAQDRKLVEARRFESSTGRFELLAPGNYVVEVIQERSGEIPGEFDFGRVYPFQFAEPFVESPDTVGIRARWDYDTVIPWHFNP